MLYAEKKYRGGTRAVLAQFMDTKTDRKMKILGISASPRDTEERKEVNHGKQSHSKELLEKLMFSVKVYGGEAEIVRLAEKNIVACDGCYSDPKIGHHCTYPCKLQDPGDDVNWILEKIIEADGLAISTPVYWGNATGTLWNLIQRMTSVENSRYKVRDQKGTLEPLLDKPVVLMASQAIEGASSTLQTLAWALINMGFTIPGWGFVFEHDIMQSKLVKIGLWALGEEVFDWVPKMVRLLGRNLVIKAEQRLERPYDDYTVIEGIT